MYFDIDFPHYRQRNREDMQAWKAAEGQHWLKRRASSFVYLDLSYIS
jgi:hypothetical protein